MQYKILSGKLNKASSYIRIAQQQQQLIYFYSRTYSFCCNKINSISFKFLPEFFPLFHSFIFSSILYSMVCFLFSFQFSLSLSLDVFLLHPTEEKVNVRGLLQGEGCMVVCICMRVDIEGCRQDYKHVKH